MDNTLHQSFKLRTKICVAINDDSLGKYNTNSQIEFKTSTLKSNLYDYSDAYIHVEGTISVANSTGERAAANNNNRKVIFKNCSPFPDCINKINNAHIDNAKDIDLIMQILNLMEYNDNTYNNDNATDFNDAINTSSLNFKEKVTSQTNADGKKNVQIAVPFKCLMMPLKNA